METGLQVPQLAPSTGTLGILRRSHGPAALVGDFKIKCLRFHTEVTESMASVGEEKQNSVTGL